MSSTKQWLQCVGIVIAIACASAAPSLHPDAGSGVLSQPGQAIRRFDGTVAAEARPTSRNTIRRYLTYVTPESCSNIILLVHSKSSNVSILNRGNDIELINILSYQDLDISASVEKTNISPQVHCIFFDFDDVGQKEIIKSVIPNNLFPVLDQQNKIYNEISTDKIPVSTFYVTRWLTDLVSSLQNETCTDATVQINESAILKGLKGTRADRKLTMNIVNVLTNDFCKDELENRQEPNRKLLDQEGDGQDSLVDKTTCLNNLVQCKVTTREEDVRKGNDESLSDQEDSSKASLFHSPTVKDINVIVVSGDEVSEKEGESELTKNSISLPPVTNVATKPLSTISTMKDALQVGIELPELSQRWTNALKAFGLSAIPTAAVAAVLTWPAAPALIAALGRRKRSTHADDYATSCRELFEKLLNTFSSHDLMSALKPKTVRKRLVKIRRKRPTADDEVEVTKPESGTDIQSLIRSLKNQFQEIRSSHSAKFVEQDLENRASSFDEGKSIVSRRKTKPVFYSNNERYGTTLQEKNNAVTYSNSLPSDFPDIQSRLPQSKHPASFHVLPVSENDDFDIVADFVEKTYNKFLDTDNKVKDDVFVINKPKFGESEPDRKNGVAGQKIQSAVIITDQKVNSSKGTPTKVEVSQLNPLMIPTGKITPSPITYFKVKPFIPPSDLSEDSIQSFLSQFSISEKNSSKVPSVYSKPQSGSIVKNLTNASIKEPSTLRPTTPLTKLEVKGTRSPMSPSFFVNPSEVPSGLKEMSYSQAEPLQKPINFGLEDFGKPLVTTDDFKISPLPSEVTITTSPLVTKTISVTNDSSMQKIFNKIVQAISTKKPQTFASNDLQSKPAFVKEQEDGAIGEKTPYQPIRNKTMLQSYDRIVQPIRKPQLNAFTSQSESTMNQVPPTKNTVYYLADQGTSTDNRFEANNGLGNKESNFLKPQKSPPQFLYQSPSSLRPGNHGNKYMQSSTMNAMSSMADKYVKGNSQMVTKNQFTKPFQALDKPDVNALMTDYDDEYYDSSTEEEITIPPETQTPSAFEILVEKSSTTTGYPLGYKPNRFIIKNVPVVVNSSETVHDVRNFIRNITKLQPDMLSSSQKLVSENSLPMITTLLDPITKNTTFHETSENVSNRNTTKIELVKNHQLLFQNSTIREKMTSLSPSLNSSTDQPENNNIVVPPVTEAVEAEPDSVVSAKPYLDLNDDSAVHIPNIQEVDGTNAIVIESDFSSPLESSASSDNNPVVSNDGTRIFNTVNTGTDSAIANAVGVVSSASSGIVVSGSSGSSGSSVKTAINLGWPLAIFVSSVAVYFGAALFPVWLAVVRKRRRTSNFTQNELIDGILLSIVSQLNGNKYKRS